MSKPILISINDKNIQLSLYFCLIKKLRNEEMNIIKGFKHLVKDSIIKSVNIVLPGSHFYSFLLSAIHSVWMIIFSLLWLTQFYLFDNFDFMNDVMDYKSLFNNQKTDTESIVKLQNDYLLLNCTLNNRIIPLDNDGKINTVITDRKELARVLNILDENSEKIKYIICDIIFDIKDNDNDSTLQSVISRLNNKGKIIMPYFLADYNQKAFIYPVFNGSIGLSQYQTSLLNDGFLKFSYILPDTLKQIPLLAYEKTTGTKMIKKKFLGISYYSMNGDWCLNTIIPNFKYSLTDLIPDETYYDMGYFIPEIIRDNQMVIIGDFEGTKDFHQSIVDKVTGSLIVLNSLEALHNGDNKLSFFYLTLLFAFFLIISYHTFFKKRISHYLSLKSKSNEVVIFIRSKINYITILFLTLISIVFFQFYFDLFIILGYFAFIEFMIWLITHFKKVQIVKKK